MNFKMKIKLKKLANFIIFIINKICLKQIIIINIIFNKSEFQFKNNK